MVRAAFRKAARIWGALPDRVRQASSRQVRSRTWCRRFSMPQCPRAMLSNEAASARSRDRLVMACTTSMLSLPRKLRRRSMRQTWRRPGHWLREEARLSLHSRRRISMRPCPFSTVSTRATSGAGAHSAEGGIRPEGQGDVGFQRRLVALDREQVIAAALDDEATEVGLGEDRIAADDRTLDGKRLEQGQSRRDLVGLRRHPPLPDDTLQPFAERGQQMHSGHIADSAAPQPLAVNRHMSGCARALHPSPEEPFQRAHIQRPEKLAPHRRRRHATAQNSKFRQGLPAQLAAPAHDPQLIRPPGQHRRQRDHQKTRKRIALPFRPPMVRDHAEHLPKIRPSRPIAARHSRPPSPVAESMNRADPDANPQNRIALPRARSRLAEIRPRSPPSRNRRTSTRTCRWPRRRTSWSGPCHTFPSPLWDAEPEFDICQAATLSEASLSPVQAFG